MQFTVSRQPSRQSFGSNLRHISVQLFHDDILNLGIAAFLDRILASWPAQHQLNKPWTISFDISLNSAHKQAGICY